MLSIQPLLRTLLICLLPLAGPVQAAEPVTLTHVHGLAYSADGKQLMIPSHDGMVLYADGRWSKAAGPAHDYMGFAATRDALYSSGHPAPGSDLVNPFGLVKSRDGGKTWQKLALEGESDFHLLAAGYGTNAIYVFNPAPNQRMRETGIYFTLNDSMKWQAASSKGLRGQPATLAVHPSEAGVVAVGTAEGLFLSRDSGQSFEQTANGKRVLGTHFDLDGKSLWYSTYAAKAGLVRVALQAGAKPEEVSTPAFAEDAIAYIAQNPARPDEITIATFKRSVFVSPDRGRTWRQIVTQGIGRDHSK